MMVCQGSVGGRHTVDFLSLTNEDNNLQYREHPGSLQIVAFVSAHPTLDAFYCPKREVSWRAELDSGSVVRPASRGSARALHPSARLA